MSTIWLKPKYGRLFCQFLECRQCTPTRVNGRDVEEGQVLIPLVYWALGTEGDEADTMVRYVGVL